MTKTCLFVLLLTCWGTAVFAQRQQMQPSRFASFYIESSLQPRQNITDSPGYTYALNRLSLGMVLPLFSKTIAPAHDSLLPNRIGVSLNPSLGYARMRISYFPQERLLLNHQVTLSSYYFFRQKNAFTLNLRALYNEDEFTISNPVLRYNFSLMYTRKVNPRFSYYAGAGYSYIFGEGLFLPLLGARFSWGRSSRLNMVLPLQVTYRTRIASKTMLSLYARPQGGINRFENRLNIQDSLQKIVMLRRRSFALGASFAWLVTNNVSIVVDPALLFGQRIAFTSDGEQKGATYIDQKVHRGLQLQVKLIWRPWQGTIRNQKRMKNEPADDDDNFILGF